MSRLGLGGRDPRARDAALAAAVWALALLGVLLSPEIEGPRALNVVLVTAMAASLLWRRSRPLAVLAWILAGAAASQLWLTPPPDIAGVVLMMIVAGFSVGAHAERTMSTVGAALVVGVQLALALAYDPADVLFPVIVFGFVPWAVGRVLRGHTLLARELAEKVGRLQHLREEDERRAVAAERARVARDLHDVLAHNLSVMVIQASAARRALEHDPAAAAEAADLIRRSGREALTELRHLFGPVRHGDGEDLSGSPGLDRLERLVERACEAGLPTTLTVEGEPTRLEPGADMAAYRVVQEALTNALKHGAGARAAVTVRHCADEVVVEVVDDGVPRRRTAPHPDGGGHGLVGMRERVLLYGGQVEAGPREGDGFRVAARIPAAPTAVRA